MLRYVIAAVLGIVAIYLFSRIYSGISPGSMAISEQCPVDNNTHLSFSQFLRVINSAGCGGREYVAGFSLDDPSELNKDYFVSQDCMPRPEYAESDIVVFGSGIGRVVFGERFKVLEYGDALIICPVI